MQGIVHTESDRLRRCAGPCRSLFCSGDDADLCGHFTSVETAQFRRPIVVTCPPTRYCSTQF